MPIKRQDFYQQKIQHMNNHFTPEVQDEAMDAFRMAFDLPLIRCHVLQNGKLMRFRLSSDRLAATYWLKASHVIEQLNLPLTPEIREWKIGDCIFDRWLEIQFDQTKTVPECY